MNTTGMGHRPGILLRKPSITPITRFCRKRWSAGRCRSFAALLPRHIEIIYEINNRFLKTVRERFPGDDGESGSHVHH